MLQVRRYGPLRQGVQREVRVIANLLSSEGVSLVVAGQASSKGVFRLVWTASVFLTSEGESLVLAGLISPKGVFHLV